MTGILEIVSYVIIGAALAQVSVSLVTTVRRHVRAAQIDSEALKIFRQRARIQLDAARAERDRTEKSWNGVRKFYIDKKMPEAADICSFYLKPHDHQPLPPFLPGQYLTFQIKLPDHSKPVVRCYSLSDAPNDRDFYRVTIKKIPPPPNKPDSAPGLISSHFHDVLNEGDIVDVNAPSGHFYLDPNETTPVVLIGGGVGLTPVLSMLNAICESESNRETWFFYGIPNRASHAMYDHLKRIQQTHDNVNIVTCYSDPTEDCVKGRDFDHQGHVSVDLFKELLPSNNYAFYICGPPPMMEAITTGLRDWGVPDSSINYEAFGPATVKRKPQAARKEDVPAEGFEIVFARTGKTCWWTEGSGSLLELAEQNEVVLDSGCRAGNCGTCVCAIKEGEVDYLVVPGADLAEGSCLTCIGVPKGRLVLDA